MFCCEYKNKLNDYLKNIISFEIFKNGENFKINSNDENYFKIINNLEKLFSTSFIMPAFGVSLNAETLNALKTDKWLQINFNKELEIDGLKFTSLLFKLETTSGINLIRLYNNEYSGRCIYLDFQEELNLNEIVK